MQTISGRRFATRGDLIQHSGYSSATLSALWRERRTNRHPAARTVEGVMHWDLEEWTAWFAEHCRRPRYTSRVDRSGDPDEQLPPAGQARLLGVNPSRITQYEKSPPPGWPDPIRVVQLPTRTREYRTRGQLWAFVDNPAGGFGTVGGRPPGPDPKARGKKRDRGEAAAERVHEHGQ